MIKPTGAPSSISSDQEQSATRALPAEIDAAAHILTSTSRQSVNEELDNEGVLSLEHVTVAFGGIQALSDISVLVHAGKITALVGPNGAGKSTLFGVCSGFVRPRGGRVILDGEDVSSMSPYVRARKGLGRTFQHPELFQACTVREHLVLARRLHLERKRLWKDLIDGSGWRSPDSAEVDAVDGILLLLGIEAVADLQVAGLPMGTCRLIEVARAIAMDPIVLLLDEPSAGLDPEETGDLGRALRRVADERRTSLLIVEHDLDFVFNLSSSVYVLDFGKMIAYGTPDEIRSNISVQAAYLGAEFDTSVGLSG